MEKNLEIVDLWPTKVAMTDLVDHNHLNLELIELGLVWDLEKQDLTTEYRDNDPFGIDSTSTNWLRAQVNDLIIEYFKTIKLNFSVDWQIHGWFSINRHGDYHDPHNHPHSYLSGTYYLQIPKDKERKGQREDVRPNRITFYDPRHGFNMGSIRSDPYVDPEFTIKPRPGLMMLWPSSLLHFVHPNLSDEVRISISFNIMLNWADHYLPGQDEFS